MKLKEWSTLIAILAVIAYFAGYNSARGDTELRCSKLGYLYVEVELGLWYFDPLPVWRKYCVAEYDGHAGRGSVRIQVDRARRVPTGAVIR